MTDAQVLTLALAIILPLSMLIHSNTRITEVKETLRAEVNAGFTLQRSEFQREQAAMRAEFSQRVRIRSIEQRMH